MRLRIASLLLAPLSLLAQAPSACNNTPAYSACEMVFELSAADAAARPAPYSSVDLKIEFRSPRQRTYAINGYWDGGGRIVVRFSPVEAGKWNYRVTSNVAAWSGQEGEFTAAASDAPGFVRPAVVHHWAYTERNLPHLWMGASELNFGIMEEAAFRSAADARAAQKFNHVRGLLLNDPAESAIQNGAPDPAYFQKLDQRVRYLNQKGIVADLVLATRPSVLSKFFSGWEQRRRFVRYLAARFSGFNVTWQGVQEFEGDVGGRAILKEMGATLKESDPFQHPRTSGARVTSAPLLDDGWMDFAAHGAGADDAVGAVEHQMYAVPFVNLDVGGDGDAEAFRHRLWNAFMNGQYPTYTRSGPACDACLKAMTAWFEFVSPTRHWELEPYFDVDGARAMALEDTQYIAYLEKPGPLELQVEKRTYDVIWMNPATGEAQKQKKQFNGDHFTGEPPDKSHDWVLHLVRPGRVESMGKSYRFESRLGPDEGSRALPIGIQDIETALEKVPFEIEQVPAAFSTTAAGPYSVRVTKPTRATRLMMWLWTGEVTSGGEGYRVLATAQKGDMRAETGMAAAKSAPLLIRLFAMNANGKVYELTKACQLTQ